MRIRATASIATPTRAVLSAVQVSAARAFASIVSAPTLVKVAAVVLTGATIAAATFTTPHVRVIEQPRIKAEVFLPYSLQEGVVAQDTKTVSISKVFVDLVVSGDSIDYKIITKVLADSVTTSDVVTTITSKPIDADTNDTDIDADPANTSDFASFVFDKPDVVDSVAAADSAAMHPQLVKADDITTTDGIDTVIVGKVLTDAVGTSDAINTLDMVLRKDDVATVVDTVAKEMTKPDVADEVAAQDTVTLHPLKASQDAVYLGDAIDDFALVLGKQDVVDTAEDLAVELTRPDVADAVSAADTMANATVKPFEDDFSVADTDAKSVVKTTADDAVTSDTTAKSIIAVLSDSVTIIDTSDQQIVPFRQFDDASSTADAMTIKDIGTGVDSLTMNGYPFDTARFN